MGFATKLRRWKKNAEDKNNKREIKIQENWDLKREARLGKDVFSRLRSRGLKYQICVGRSISFVIRYSYALLGKASCSRDFILRQRSCFGMLVVVKRFPVGILC